MIKQAVFISVTQLHYHERAAITGHNDPLYPSVANNPVPADTAGVLSARTHCSVALAQGALRMQWNGNDTCSTKVRLWNDPTKTTTQICDRNTGKEINRIVLTWQSKGFGCTTNTKQGCRVFYMSYLWQLYNLWLAQTQIMSWSASSLSDDAFVRSAKVQWKGRLSRRYIYVLCENTRAQSAAWIVPLFAQQNITHLTCKGPNACFIRSARKL